MPLRDILIALLVVAVLGVNFVAIKLGLSEAPPLLLTAMRFFFAALPAALLIGPPRAPALIVAGFGAMLGVVQFGLLFTAIGLGMPAGLSSLVIQLQVFFTIGLACVALGERPAAHQVGGGLVAGLGVVAIALVRAQGAPVLPLLLVIGAAAAWAGANTLVKRAGPVDMLALMVWGSMTAWPLLLALSLLLEGPGAILGVVMHPSWRLVGSVAFLAYPTTLLAFGLWNRLLSKHPAASVAPFALLVPVAGIASTTAFAGEPLGRGELLGAALVLIGLGLNVWGSRVRLPTRTA